MMEESREFHYEVTLWKSLCINQDSLTLNIKGFQSQRKFAFSLLQSLWGVLQVSTAAPFQPVNEELGCCYILTPTF